MQQKFDFIWKRNKYISLNELLRIYEYKPISDKFGKKEKAPPASVGVQPVERPASVGVQPVETIDASTQVGTRSRLAQSESERLNTVNQIDEQMRIPQERPNPILTKKLNNKATNTENIIEISKHIGIMDLKSILQELARSLSFNQLTMQNKTTALMAVERAIEAVANIGTDEPTTSSLSHSSTDERSSLLPVKKPVRICFENNDGCTVCKKSDDITIRIFSVASFSFQCLALLCIFITNSAESAYNNRCAVHFQEFLSWLNFQGLHEHSFDSTCNFF